MGLSRRSTQRGRELSFAAALTNFRNAHKEDFENAVVSLHQIGMTSVDRDS
jgi:hypothetical protein